MTVPGSDFLLLEDGRRLLLEDGFHLLLEDGITSTGVMTLPVDKILAEVFDIEEMGDKDK